jgi:predicted small secreted protein
MRKVAVAVLVVATLALGACNTVKGAGRDIQSVGQAGEDALKS